MKITYSSTSGDDRILSFKGDNFNLDLESKDIDLLKLVLQKAKEIENIMPINGEHEMLFNSDELLLEEIQNKNGRKGK